MTSARPSRSTRSAMRRSCSSNRRSRSISSTTTSAKRIALIASATDSFSSFSSIRGGRRSPAVSCRWNSRPFQSEIDLDGVAGDAGLGPGEHAVLAEQPVHQRRLAGVRPPDHGDADRDARRPAVTLSFGKRRPVSPVSSGKASRSASNRSTSPSPCSAEMPTGSPRPSS